MHRLKFLIGGILVALAATGIAIAGSSAQTQTAAATFSAKAKRVATRTCQGSDGTYKITKGVYWGTMTSTDPRLNGQMRIELHSVYNVDEKLGWMRGHVDVRNSTADGRAKAEFAAVNEDGSVEGLMTGAGGPPRAKLLANFSATFTGDTVDDGKLGTGGSANEALFFGGACSDENSKKPDDGSKPSGDKPSGDRPSGDKPTGSDQTQQQTPTRK